jgi:hypothetical protein
MDQDGEGEERGESGAQPGLGSPEQHLEQFRMGDEGLDGGRVPRQPPAQFGDFARGVADIGEQLEIVIAESLYEKQRVLQHHSLGSW